MLSSLSPPYANEAALPSSSPSRSSSSPKQQQQQQQQQQSLSVNLIKNQTQMDTSSAEDSPPISADTTPITATGSTSVALTATLADTQSVPLPMDIDKDPSLASTATATITADVVDPTSTTPTGGPEVAARALNLFTFMEQNEYKGIAEGRATAVDIIPCACQYLPGRLLDSPSS